MKRRDHDVKDPENADRVALMRFRGQNKGKVMLQVANVE